MKPGDSSFTFIVPTTDSQGQITTRVANSTDEVVSGGFVFNLHIDNNPCTASIDVTNIGGISKADTCGMLGYSSGADLVTISFHAQHPNNYAFFSFTMVRGITGLSSVDDEVTASKAGEYVGDGSGDFSADFPASSLLDTCTNAAFAEHLYVSAKATTGNGYRIFSYDSEYFESFALEKS